MSSRTVAGHDREIVPARVLGGDLAAVLYRALREAVDRLEAIAAAVYFLDEDSGELKAAMIGGCSPPVFTLPGRMAPDAPYASARALAAGAVVVLTDPDPRTDDLLDLPNYPYAVAAAPLVADGLRLGALAVLRPETQGGYDDTDRARLAGLGDRLAQTLRALAGHGTAIVPGHMPVLVPIDRVGRAETVDEAAGDVLWGVRGVAGSAGMSMMYPLRRLSDMLNQATTMEQVVGAARFCVMVPFQARALVLAAAGRGRLWVVGHSGVSSDLARTLHGSGLHTREPAAEAVRRRALVVSGRCTPLAAGPLPPDDGAPSAAYLPLVGNRHVIDLPYIGKDNVVGVCCLEFGGPRRFSPEERAVLSMMAGSMGPAVERVELGRERHAVAESLQKRLLPPVLSESPQLTTTARYEPATSTSEVGGDWYDVIELPGRRVVLVVGDVEGHGIESAALMGQLRGAVVAYATEGHRPAAIIDRTGALLARLGTDLLATCCVVALDTTDGVAEVALAGHPPPLVMGPDAGVTVLEAPPNVPLGVPVPACRRGREHTVAPGSVLMLYSDGLVDARAPDPTAAAATLFRTGDRAAGDNLEELADRVVAGMPGFHHRRDDAVLLLARFEGADVRDVSRTGHLHLQEHDLLGVKAARGFVEDSLRAWGLEEMSEDLQLVASEVVTNALIHAGSDVDVRLRAFGDNIRMEVRDSDSDPPVPSAFSLTEEGSSQAESGRGLYLVDALTSAWNSSPNGRGKTVWLEMAIPGN
ncbi:SpoIIE family protein phosphatase [Streptomyces sp. MI02-7b]|uniref:SpoIIE family protein phosphatase n=1 Tax=Streptomyces sp. MI02-7b TaxID=462941 RepID=UPI0029B51512|nr:SpoIIE family protein phosphatase [Streptomyces sp. MI02-7b]MDX3078174.1 SpoIIE family protein phosphatase [Streptomyces sp. MI02-7b]